MIVQHKTQGNLLDRRPNWNWILTEEKLDEISAVLKLTAWKSHRHLAQEIRVSKSSAWMTTLVPEMQPVIPLTENFCNGILWSLHDGEI